MGVIAEAFIYIVFDLLLTALAALLVPLVSFGRARVVPIDHGGAFPFHGFRRAADGRIEVGRSQAGLYLLLACFVLLTVWVVVRTR